MTADVGAIADELYSLPAGEFTAARDRIAAETRRAGDRALATAIKQLRRPTATAWSANQLVRQRRHEVARLLEVGAALRDAQTRLAGDDLRRLTQEGQRLVTDLGRQARQLAADAGQSLSEEAVRELEETLRAALADPAASDALRSGHLTAALHYSGFGLVDLPVAPLPPQDAGRPEPLGPSPGPHDPETAVTRPVGLDVAGATPAVRETEVAASAAAEQAVGDAEADLATARQDAADQARRAEDASQRLAALRRQIDQLNEQMKRLRVDEAEAAQQARQEARGQRAAERAARAAEDRLELARDALDRSRPGP